MWRVLAASAVLLLLASASPVAAQWQMIDVGGRVRHGFPDITYRIGVHLMKDFEDAPDHEIDFTLNGPGTLNPSQVTTDSVGEAYVSYTFPHAHTDGITLDAVLKESADIKVQFELPMSKVFDIAIHAGDNEKADELLHQHKLQVKVTNDLGDPAQGVSIAWEMLQGSGLIKEPYSQSDANGIATSNLYSFKESIVHTQASIDDMKQKNVVFKTYVSSCVIYNTCEDCVGMFGCGWCTAGYPPGGGICTDGKPNGPVDNEYKKACGTWKFGLCSPPPTASPLSLFIGYGFGGACALGGVYLCLLTVMDRRVKKDQYLMLADDDDDDVTGIAEADVDVPVRDRMRQLIAGMSPRAMRAAAGKPGGGGAPPTSPQLTSLLDGSDTGGSSVPSSTVSTPRSTRKDGTLKSPRGGSLRGFKGKGKSKSKSKSKAGSVRSTPRKSKSKGGSLRSTPRSSKSKSKSGSMRSTPRGTGSAPSSPRMQDANETSP